MIQLRRAYRCWAGAASVLLLASGARAADPPAPKPKAGEPAVSEASAPSRAQCLEAHRNAQELKQSSKLLEMQEQLQVCSSATCPGAIITDCGTWISELEQTTPSMVFEVRLDGKEALDATVLVDGQPVTERSHALKVNPGRHAVRVELPGFEPRDQDVVLPEGQRMRLISVEFASKKAEPAPPLAPVQSPPKETVRPTPFAVYPLLVVGVAGAASFGAFSFLGRSEQSDLEKSCAPSCKDSELRPMKRWYMIADVSAGVGAAALIGAAVVYLSRPTKEVDRAAGGLSLGVGSVGLGTSAIGSVGLNASRVW